MKKLFLVLLSLSLTLALASCGDSSSSDGDKVYELSFSMHTAAESTYGELFQTMFDEIYEKTDGHVKITIFGSGTLASAGDVADFVADGGADMGWLFTSFYYGQYPLSDVISVPMQGAQTSEQGTQVLWDLYETYEEMANEWSQFKTLQIYANPVSYVYSSIPISSVQDIAGKSIRSTSNGVAEVLGGWGANVISMPPNDIYDGISKNNIQGYTAEPTMLPDYSLTEVTPYMMDVSLYQAPFVMVMNQDVYNSLPAEYQAVLDEYATREASLVLAKGIDAYVEQTMQDALDGGMQVLTPTDEAYAEFQKAADTFTEDWIAQYTTDTFDAKEYYDFCAAAYAKYAK